MNGIHCIILNYGFVSLYTKYDPMHTINAYLAAMFSSPQMLVSFLQMALQVDCFLILALHVQARLMHTTFIDGLFTLH